MSITDPQAATPAFKFPGTSRVQVAVSNVGRASFRSTQKDQLEQGVENTRDEWVRQGQRRRARGGERCKYSKDAFKKV